MTKDLSSFYRALEEYQSILKSKKRRETLLGELRTYKLLLTELERNIVKEYNDIIELESKPIVVIFSRVLKNEVEQLEKERQEYLMAVLEHKECSNLIKLYEYELQILNNTITKQDSIEVELRKEILKIETEHQDSRNQQILKIQESIAEIKGYQNLKLEITDVINVINQIIVAFHTMIDAINKAKTYDNWGEFYKEIQKGKEIKKGHLDEAQSNLYLIKKLLVFLKVELKDISDIQNTNVGLELYNFNVNYYSNLITDWLQDSNLSATLISTLITHLNLTKLKRDLDTIYKNTTEKLVSLDESRVILIENFNNT